MGSLAEELEYEYPVWRLWLEGKDSFREICEQWDYNTVMKANALLDMRETYEAGINEMEDERIEKETRKYGS